MLRDCLIASALVVLGAATQPTFAQSRLAVGLLECRAGAIPLKIENGSVGYNGYVPVRVSGSVAGNGAVTVRVSSGGRNASGSGHLSGDSGTGTWSGSASDTSCSGTWTAHRTA